MSIDISQVVDHQNEWLEDILAGLLAAGTDRADIDVQHHPENQGVVCVRGEPKYEWRFETPVRRIVPTITE